MRCQGSRRWRSWWTLFPSIWDPELLMFLCAYVISGGEGGVGLCADYAGPVRQDLCVEQANNKEFMCKSILILETHSPGLGKTKSMTHY
ncbi:hypothetical protein BDA96_08G084600 [Sorghum bicolor]|uniref:Uncharacterized protein n=2 Tax=Sorghum bicolor TaxID=4558 RepID=A0A1B6PC81_SORBI|nr:hypothetical protein BDA96_08G084600 [Sorghum bicolor]KXG23289.1 hypothetical protein SORBI_3008G079100 [Sorghum bicolor]